MGKIKLLFVYFLMIIFTINIGAVSRLPGQVQFASYDTVYYIYLKQGEKLNFKAITKNNGNKPVDMKLTPPVGSSLSDITRAVGSGTPSGTTIDFTPTDITSDVDGVWSISAINHTGSGTGSTYYTFLYDINTYNTGGSEVFGKVWTENYKLYQISTNNNNNLDNLQLWHKTIGGYLYLSEFKQYNGVLSEIVSDPIGLTRIQQPDCLPEYSSYRYTLKPNYAQQYNILSEVASCKNTVNSNKIFIDEPNSNLPSEVILPDGTSTWLNKDIGELEGSLATESLSSTTYETKIDYSIDNFEGILELQIDTNNNGSYDDAEDITVSKVYRYGDGNKFIVWDGKDANGNPVSLDREVNIRLFVRGLGEIHFINKDVEKNVGGIEVTRLNGVSSTNGKELYWNDSTLGISGCTTPIIDALSGIDSTGGVHSWNNNLQCIYSKPEDLTISENTSWGDGNFIHNWTYEKVDKEIVKTTIYPKSLDLAFTKSVIDESKDQLVTPNEKFTYSLKIDNKSSYRFTDIQVRDTVADILPYIVNKNNPEKIKVDINNNGTLSTITLLDLINGYDLSIDQMSSITLTFKLQLLNEEELKQLKNVNYLSNTASIKNRSSEEIKASSKIKVKFKEKDNDKDTPIPEGGRSNLELVVIITILILGLPTYYYYRKS